MKKYYQLLILSLAAILFVVGCDSQKKSQINIEMKSIEEQIEMVKSFTYNDYKKLFMEVVAEAKNIGEEDEQLNKWIIRTLGEEKLYYKTKLTQDQVVQLAQQQMDELTAWKSVAIEEYGITISDEDVDKFIVEGPDKSDLINHLAYADALGLTLHELNRHFDIDLHERNVIWDKLLPLLEKKYGTSDNNLLVQKYAVEVKKKLKSL